MQKVLIVDDQPDIRRLIRWSLEVLDVELHEAVDGAAALASALDVRPDVMLLDMMMPGALDGLEVCRRLKAADGPTTPPPRIVLLSAKGQVTDVEDGLGAGADAYLVKPFSPQRLVSTVEKLLRPATA